MTNTKSLGWAIYAVGFAIWLLGYLSAGHASIFHWDVTTPWWISSFVPNLEAEVGLALMSRACCRLCRGLACLLLWPF
jgi:hypothetical protein